MAMKNFSPGERLFAADLNDNFAETQKGANITSGTVAANRIANLDAGKITSGTFVDARIPNLNASKINAGQFNEARLPNGYRIRSGRLGVANVNSNSVLLTTVTFPSGSFSSAPRVITAREFGNTIAAQQRDVNWSFGGVTATGFTYYRSNISGATQGVAGPWLAVG